MLLIASMLLHELTCVCVEEREFELEHAGRALADCHVHLQWQQRVLFEPQLPLILIALVFHTTEIHLRAAGRGKQRKEERSRRVYRRDASAMWARRGVVEMKMVLTLRGVTHLVARDARAHQLCARLCATRWRLVALHRYVREVIELIAAAARRGDKATHGDISVRQVEADTGRSLLDGPVERSLAFRDARHREEAVADVFWSR
mmetsp:Transcript_2377/g.6188  ORF Transcript_2377/g.6188 Transcript_2377/m.6188 type:complete len:204 (-) Transcript_2377:35-646(-)